MNRNRSMFALVMWASTTVCLASDADRFSSPTVGFAFSKASEWRFASVDAMQENREKIRLNDEEFEKLMRERATPPLAVVMKHEEPYPDVNPSFQVGFRPLGGLAAKSARELVEILLPSYEKIFADYELVAAVSDVVVGGLPAARVGFNYTLKTNDGGAYPTRSDMVVVPRGKFMFLIGMGRKQGDDVATAELERMLASVEIQP
jgi:hypothetical protein